MSRKRRILLIVTVSVVLLVGALWAVLHIRPVQRELADSVIAAVEQQTGWVIEIGELRVRLWPARLVATDVAVSAGTSRVATVDRLEASWKLLMSTKSIWTGRACRSNCWVAELHGWILARMNHCFRQPTLSR